MKDSIKLEGKPLQEEQYKAVIKNLFEKKYKLIIDPRQFDSPISIKTRFKIEDSKIRFIEFSPDLELSIEHNFSKKKAQQLLKELSREIEHTIKVGSVKAEDFERATLEMIARRNAVISPKNEAEQELFKSLEEKRIFLRAIPLKCPNCSQTFMMPAKNIRLAEKAFCVDCNMWFEHKEPQKELYVINEDYMEVIGSLWDKVQKLIKTSWREITKRGLPAFKP